ncbi:MAG TPA: ABC transporter permease [Rhodanobacteraceae bacterium]|nr:ABC transporter permease [Rhodanobacteraceae bacterium]
MNTAVGGTVHRPRTRRTNAIVAVWWKEVLENLRDKRTVMSALIYAPLFGPLMFVVLMNVMINHEMAKAEGPLKVPVIGAQYAPNLIAALKQQGLDPQPSVGDPEAAVRNRDADVVLRIPSDYAKAWSKGEPAQVELIYDASQTSTSTPRERLEGMLKNYIRQQGAMRLVARGLSPGIATPVVIADRDQSTPQSRSGLVFGILPYFFVIAIFVGGMYLAIDLTAGERERQSLEPLFANPVARWRILVGKLGAICAFSLASLVLCAIGFAAAGHFMPAEKLGMSFDLGATFIGKALLLELPLLALFAVLQTLVAAFAKSYREAQTYLSFLMILPILPSMLMSFMPVKPVTWMYAVPLLGQQIGISELLRGRSIGMGDIGIALVCGFAATVIVGLITARIYKTERLAISA